MYPGPMPTTTKGVDPTGREGVVALTGSWTEPTTAPDGDPGIAGMVVGRRPVLDTKLSVLGYRLAIAGDRPDALTAEIIERASRDGGLAHLFGSKLAFV